MGISLPVDFLWPPETALLATDRPRSNSQPAAEGSACVNTPALLSLRVITAVCFTLFLRIPQKDGTPVALKVSYLMRHPLFAAFSS